jgi:broad specificity polyphosphatase/5'/3'-nucleotidase SurE
MYAISGALQVAASICNEVLLKPDPTIRICTINNPNVRENEVEKCRL